MRKAISLLSALVLALLLTVPAFADGRGPTFTEYDVICTGETPYYTENWDRDGAFEKKGTLPKDTVLTVQYEYEKDGVLYCNVKIGHGDDAEWVYVRLSDVRMKNDVYMPQNDMQLPQSFTVCVIAKGGVPLYAGPNEKYEKLMTIPRGAKLTYSYANDKYRDFRSWAFVTYLGRSGWIYVYAYDTKNGLAQVPDESDNAEIWVLDDGVQLYDGISFGNIESYFRDDWSNEYLEEMHEEPSRVIGKLEKGKKYTYRYYHEMDYGTWYFVTAGLRRGWVFASYLGERIAEAVRADNEYPYMLFRDTKVKLLETPDPDANGTTVRLAANTVPVKEYYLSTNDDQYYYTTVDGNSGWIDQSVIRENGVWKVGEEDAETFQNRQNRSGESVPIYSNIMTKNKTVGKVPADGYYTTLYSGSYSVDNPDSEYDDWVEIEYIRYGSVTGWVESNDLYAPPEEETTEEPEDEEEYEDYDYDDAYDESTWDDWEEDETEAFVEPDVPQNSGLSPLQIILICVGGAVVLALTAVVTLLLIRRKRTAKRVPDTPDNEPTEPDA